MKCCGRLGRHAIQNRGKIGATSRSGGVGIALGQVQHGIDRLNSTIEELNSGRIVRKPGASGKRLALAGKESLG